MSAPASLALIQMHGEPGSGKTTIARALAPCIPAIHLDKDVVMTAIMEASIPRELAGPASYESMRAVARGILQQGQSVILDSPAFWPIIESSARGLANESGATFLMIECRCQNKHEIDRRLATRERLPTHPRERHDWLAVPGTCEPGSRRLVLDTTLPVEKNVCRALQYVHDGGRE